MGGRVSIDSRSSFDTLFVRLVLTSANTIIRLVSRNSGIIHDTGTIGGHASFFCLGPKRCCLHLFVSGGKSKG